MGAGEATGPELEARLRGAWQGRVSGCQLGKPVELISIQQGQDAVREYLERAGALPLRDYVPLVEGDARAALFAGSCKGRMVHLMNCCAFMGR